MQRPARRQVVHALASLRVQTAPCSLTQVSKQVSKHAFTCDSARKLALARNPAGWHGWMASTQIHQRHAQRKRHAQGMQTPRKKRHIHSNKSQAGGGTQHTNDMQGAERTTVRKSAAIYAGLKNQPRPAPIGR